MSLFHIMRGIARVGSWFALAAAAGAQTTVYQFQVPAGGYDAASNLLNYSDTVNGTWALTYDPLNRLATSWSNAGPYNGIIMQEQYDSFGNRWGQTAWIAPQYSPDVEVPNRWAHVDLTSNRIISSESAPGGLTYDTAGNVVSDGSNQNAYDGDGRLCASQNGVSGTITQYVYDAEGRRTAKITGSSSLVCYTGASTGGTLAATYLLGPGGEQVSEFDGSGKWRHSNVFSGGALLAAYDTTGVHFPVHDALGTLREQISGTGVLEETCANLPFGDAQFCDNDVPEPNELHFTGKERDTESGLDYFGARYYAGTMGHWMSPDWADKPEAVPYSHLNSPQSLNLYSYVNNNPLTHSDSDGHCYPWCTALIGAGIGAAAEFTHQAIQGNGFDGGKITAAAVGGAVIGVVGPAGTAAGLGAVGIGGFAVYGAVLGGATERVINGALSGKQETPNPMPAGEVAKDAAEGLVGVAVGKAAATIAAPIAKTAAEAVGNLAVDTARRNNDAPPTPPPPSPPPPPPTPPPANNMLHGATS